MYFPSNADRPAQAAGRRPVAHRRGRRRAVRLRALARGGSSGLFGAYYFPLAQSPDRGVAIVARTTQTPESLTSAMRAAVREVDAVGAGVRREHDGGAARRRAHRSAHADDPGGPFAAWRCCWPRSASTACWPTRWRSARARSASAWRSAPAPLASSRWCCARAHGGRASAPPLGMAGAWLLRAALQAQLYEVDAMDPRVIAMVGGVLARWRSWPACCPRGAPRRRIQPRRWLIADPRSRESGVWLEWPPAADEEAWWRRGRGRRLPLQASDVAPC